MGGKEDCVCNDYERWELFALVGFVVCLWHLRLSPWLGLVAIGLLGVVLSACLHGLSQFSPEGDVDPYRTGDFRLLLLQTGWAMRGASWLGIVVGLTAALIHIRRKINALQRAAGLSRMPEPDALRPWSERTQPASRDIRP